MFDSDRSFPAVVDASVTETTGRGHVCGYRSRLSQTLVKPLSEVRWISRTPDRTFLLTASEAVMLLKAGNETDAIKMRMIGGVSNPSHRGNRQARQLEHYFIGADADQWRTAVPHYGRVRYKNVYPGIDVVYHSTDRRLEYDFVLAGR